MQHFVRFSTSFPQTETETDAHTLLNFLLYHEMRHTLQIDIHLEASTERMQGDTGFWLCKYTCTELPPVLPFCHFAAYYSFPRKKSVPESNDQPMYILPTLLDFFHNLLSCIYLSRTLVSPVFIFFWSSQTFCINQYIIYSQQIKNLCFVIDFLSLLHF